MIRNTLLTFALSMPFAVNAQTEVPHEFQAGTPARSAEVNANFDALETAVDENGDRITQTEAGVAENATNIQMNTSDIENNASDIATNTTNISSNGTSISVNAVSINENLTAIENNSSAITTLATAAGVEVYSQGESIGRFLSPSNVLGAAGVFDFGDFWTISDQGYVFLVNPVNHPSASYLVESEIAFSGEDCTGDAYVVLDLLTAQFTWAAVVGHVVRLSGPLPQPVYYTRKGSELSQSLTYLSVYKDSCKNEPGTGEYAIRVLPNDREVTGVSDTPPVRPLTLGTP